MSSRSINSAKISGAHFKQSCGLSKPSMAKIFPPILKHRSSPHCRFSDRMNVLALDQLSKNLRRALQTKLRIVQTEHGKNLPADLEAQIVAPLQILRSDECPRARSTQQKSPARTSNKAADCPNRAWQKSSRRS